MEIKNKRILDLEKAYRNKLSTHKILTKQFKSLEVETTNMIAHVFYSDYNGIFTFGAYEKPTNNLNQVGGLISPGTTHQLQNLEEYIEVLNKLKNKLEENNNGE